MNEPIEAKIKEEILPISAYFLKEYGDGKINKKDVIRSLRKRIYNNNDNYEEIYKKLKEIHGNSGVCTRQWKEGSFAFKCYNCEGDPTCAICANCFFASNHKNHVYKLTHTSGGCCDCGDTSWNINGACYNHRGINEESLIVKKNILKENVKNQIKQDIENLVGILFKDIILKDGFFLSLVNADYVEYSFEFFKDQGITSFLFRQIICEVFTGAKIDFLINFHYCFHTGIQKALYSLYLSLFVDPQFKQRFAFKLSKHYNIIVRVVDDRIYNDYSLNGLSVQLLTVPEIGYTLVINNFLNDLIKIIESFCTYSNVSKCVMFKNLLRSEIEIIMRICLDLKYLLYHQEVIKIILFNKYIIKKILNLLTLLHRMNSQLRYTKRHIIYEDLSSSYSITIENYLLKVFEPLANFCKREQNANYRNFFLLYQLTIEAICSINLFPFSNDKTSSEESQNVSGSVQSMPTDTAAPNQGKQKKEIKKIIEERKKKRLKHLRSLHSPLVRFFMMILNFDVIRKCIDDLYWYKYVYLKKVKKQKEQPSNLPIHSGKVKIIKEYINDFYSIEKYPDEIINKRKLLQERYEGDGNKIKMKLFNYKPFLNSYNPIEHSKVDNYLKEHKFLEETYFKWIINMGTPKDSTKVGSTSVTAPVTIPITPTTAAIPSTSHVGNGSGKVHYRRSIQEKKIKGKCKNLFIEKKINNKEIEFNEFLEIKYKKENKNIYLHPLYIQLYMKDLLEFLNLFNLKLLKNILFININVLSFIYEIKYGYWVRNGPQMVFQSNEYEASIFLKNDLIGIQFAFIMMNILPLYENQKMKINENLMKIFRRIYNERIANLVGTDVHKLKKIPTTSKTTIPNEDNNKSKVLLTNSSSMMVETGNKVNENDAPNFRHSKSSDTLNHEINDNLYGKIEYIQNQDEIYQNNKQTIIYDKNKDINENDDFLNIFCGNGMTDTSINWANLRNNFFSNNNEDCTKIKNKIEFTEIYKLLIEYCREKGNANNEEEANASNLQPVNPNNENSCETASENVSNEQKIINNEQIKTNKINYKKLEWIEYLKLFMESNIRNPFVFIYQLIFKNFRINLDKTNINDIYMEIQIHHLKVIYKIFSDIYLNKWNIDSRKITYIFYFQFFYDIIIRIFNELYYFDSSNIPRKTSYIKYTKRGKYQVKKILLQLLASKDFQHFQLEDIFPKQFRHHPTFYELINKYGYTTHMDRSNVNLIKLNKNAWYLYDAFWPVAEYKDFQSANEKSIKEENATYIGPSRTQDKEYLNFPFKKLQNLLYYAFKNSCLTPMLLTICVTNEAFQTRLDQLKNAPPINESNTSSTSNISNNVSSAVDNNTQEHTQNDSILSTGNSIDVNSDPTSRNRENQEATPNRTPTDLSLLSDIDVFNLLTQSINNSLGTDQASQNGQNGQNGQNSQNNQSSQNRAEDTTNTGVPPNTETNQEDENSRAIEGSRDGNSGDSSESSYQTGNGQDIHQTINNNNTYIIVDQNGDNETLFAEILVNRSPNNSINMEIVNITDTHSGDQNTRRGSRHLTAGGLSELIRSLINENNIISNVIDETLLGNNAAGIDILGGENNGNIRRNHNRPIISNQNNNINRGAARGNSDDNLIFDCYTSSEELNDIDSEGSNILRINLTGRDNNLDNLNIILNSNEIIANANNANLSNTIDILIKVIKVLSILIDSSHPFKEINGFYYSNCKVETDDSDSASDSIEESSDEDYYQPPSPTIEKELNKTSNPNEYIFNNEQNSDNDCKDHIEEGDEKCEGENNEDAATNDNAIFDYISIVEKRKKGKKNKSIENDAQNVMKEKKIRKEKQAYSMGEKTVQFFINSINNINGNEDKCFLKVRNTIVSRLKEISSENYNYKNVNNNNEFIELAKKKQQDLLDSMKKQQLKFSQFLDDEFLSDEDEELEMEKELDDDKNDDGENDIYKENNTLCEYEKAKEKNCICVLCKEGMSKNNLLAYMCFASHTNILKKIIKKNKMSFPCKHPSIYTCGHFIHTNCLHNTKILKYRKLFSVKNEPTLYEFTCPLCRCIANCFIVYIPKRYTSKNDTYRIYDCNETDFFIDNSNKNFSDLLKSASFALKLWNQKKVIGTITSDVQMVDSTGSNHDNNDINKNSINSREENNYLEVETSLDINEREKNKSLHHHNMHKKFDEYDNSYSDNSESFCFENESTFLSSSSNKSIDSDVANEFYFKYKSTQKMKEEKVTNNNNTSNNKNVGNDINQTSWNNYVTNPIFNEENNNDIFNLNFKNLIDKNSLFDNLLSYESYDKNKKKILREIYLNENKIYEQLYNTNDCCGSIYCHGCNGSSNFESGKKNTYGNNGIEKSEYDTQSDRKDLNHIDNCRRINMNTYKNNDNVKEVRSKDGAGTELYLYKNTFNYPNKDFTFTYHNSNFFYRYKNGFLSYYVSVPLKFMKNVEFVMIQNKSLNNSNNKKSKRFFFTTSVEEIKTENVESIENKEEQNDTEKVDAIHVEKNDDENVENNNDINKSELNLQLNYNIDKNLVEYIQHNFNLNKINCDEVIKKYRIFQNKTNTPQTNNCGSSNSNSISNGKKKGINEINEFQKEKRLKTDYESEFRENILSEYENFSYSPPTKIENKESNEYSIKTGSGIDSSLIENNKCDMQDGNSENMTVPAVNTNEEIMTSSEYFISEKSKKVEEEPRRNSRRRSIQEMEEMGIIKSNDNLSICEGDENYENDTIQFKYNCDKNDLKTHAISMKNCFAVDIYDGIISTNKKFYKTYKNTVYKQNFDSIFDMKALRQSIILLGGITEISWRIFHQNHTTFSTILHHSENYKKIIDFEYSTKIQDNDEDTDIKGISVNDVLKIYKKLDVYPEFLFNNTNIGYVNKSELRNVNKEDLLLFNKKDKKKYTKKLEGNIFKNEANNELSFMKNCLNQLKKCKDNEDENKHEGDTHKKIMKKKRGKNRVDSKKKNTIKSDVLNIKYWRNINTATEMNKIYWILYNEILINIFYKNINYVSCNNLIETLVRNLFLYKHELNIVKEDKISNLFNLQLWKNIHNISFYYVYPYRFTFNKYKKFFDKIKKAHFLNKLSFLPLSVDVLKLFMTFFLNQLLHIPAAIQHFISISLIIISFQVMNEVFIKEISKSYVQFIFSKFSPEQVRKYFNNIFEKIYINIQNESYPINKDAHLHDRVKLSSHFTQSEYVPKENDNFSIPNYMNTNSQSKSIAHEQFKNFIFDNFIKNNKELISSQNVENIVSNDGSEFSKNGDEKTGNYNTFNNDGSLDGSNDKIDEHGNLKNKEVFGKVYTNQSSSVSGYSDGDNMNSNGRSKKYTKLINKMDILTLFNNLINLANDISESEIEEIKNAILKNKIISANIKKKECYSHICEKDVCLNKNKTVYNNEENDCDDCCLYEEKKTLYVLYETLKKMISLNKFKTDTQKIMLLLCEINSEYMKYVYYNGYIPINIFLSTNFIRYDEFFNNYYPYLYNKKSSSKWGSFHVLYKEKFSEKNSKQNNQKSLKKNKNVMKRDFNYIINNRSDTVQEQTPKDQSYLENKLKHVNTDNSKSMYYPNGETSNSITESPTLHKRDDIKKNEKLYENSKNCFYTNPNEIHQFKYKLYNIHNEEMNDFYLMNDKDENYLSLLSKDNLEHKHTNMCNILKWQYENIPFINHLFYVYNVYPILFKLNQIKDIHNKKDNDIDICSNEFLLSQIDNKIYDKFDNYNNFSDESFDSSKTIRAYEEEENENDEENNNSSEKVKQKDENENLDENYTTSSLNVLNEILDVNELIKDLKKKKKKKKKIYKNKYANNFFVNFFNKAMQKEQNKRDGLELEKKTGLQTSYTNGTIEHSGNKNGSYNDDEKDHVISTANLFIDPHDLKNVDISEHLDKMDKSKEEVVEENKINKNNENEENYYNSSLENTAYSISTENSYTDENFLYYNNNGESSSGAEKMRYKKKNTISKLLFSRFDDHTSNRNDKNSKNKSKNDNINFLKFKDSNKIQRYNMLLRRNDLSSQFFYNIRKLYSYVYNILDFIPIYVIQNILLHYQKSYKNVNHYYYYDEQNDGINNLFNSYNEESEYEYTRYSSNYFNTDKWKRQYEKYKNYKNNNEYERIYSKKESDYDTSSCSFDKKWDKDSASHNESKMGSNFSYDMKNSGANNINEYVDPLGATSKNSSFTNKLGSSIFSHNFLFDEKYKSTEKENNSENRNSYFANKKMKTNHSDCASDAYIRCSSQFTKNTNKGESSFKMKFTNEENNYNDAKGVRGNINQFYNNIKDEKDILGIKKIFFIFYKYLKKNNFIDCNFGEQNKKRRRNRYIKLYSKFLKKYLKSANIYLQFVAYILFSIYEYNTLATKYLDYIHLYSDTSKYNIFLHILNINNNIDKLYTYQTMQLIFHPYFYWMYQIYKYLKIDASPIALHDFYENLEQFISSNSIFQPSQNYFTLIKKNFKRKCVSCNKSPKKILICLYCGSTICLHESDEATGPLSQTISKCIYHTTICGGDQCLYLCLNTSSILFTSENRFEFMSGPYVDKNGDIDPHLKRGKNLYLSQHKLNQIFDVIVNSTADVEIYKHTLKAE
ncbi:asparagine/aspartate rich protein, putative [Plasmodium vinckei]|uniref:RING-type E3 ubiquitin transferase n=1 Tax=Plasmodium vinckei TaxID=5860 RepID=A0A6V7TJC3_PLAVN|nr:asparagine/aspartate rich protein, putative [Plasmodium vinckei]